LPSNVESQPAGPGIGLDEVFVPSVGDAWTAVAVECQALGVVQLSRGRHSHTRRQQGRAEKFLCLVFVMFFPLY